MSDRPERERRSGTLPIAAVIGKVIAPVLAKRGFASADLIGAWSAVVGPRFAATTAPDKITWPRRGASDEPGGATLTIRVEGADAIFLQHEASVIRERVNAFLGFAAIARIKLIQAPVARTDTAGTRPPPPSPRAKAAAEALVGDLEPGPLRDALARWGAAVHAEVERS